MENNNNAKIRSNFLLRTFFVTSFLIILFFIAIKGNSYLENKHAPSTPLAVNNQEQLNNNVDDKVLGYNTPEIYISNNSDGGYTMGGMIALASNAEPAVELRTYNVIGQVEISLFKANEDALLKFLMHDEKGAQIKAEPDTNSLELIKQFSEDINSKDSFTKLILPIENSGIYFISVKKDKLVANNFIVRSKVGTVVKEGNNELIFWGQNFDNRRSISKGELKIYNLNKQVKEIASKDFDSEGVAVTGVSQDYDIAIVKSSDDIGVVPLNLQYLNTNYGHDYYQFDRKERAVNMFLFTDRPLYRPGDKVYFKSIIRNDDDVRYTIPTGKANVKVNMGWYNSEDIIFEKSYSISNDGTIAGEFELPETLQTGSYSMSVTYDGKQAGYASFQVEYFRKPEYFIDIDSDKAEFIASDKGSVTLSGNYFYGQPLTEGKVEYTVYISNFYEYDYYSDKAAALNDNYRYGYWGSNINNSGVATLDKNGKAVIELDTNQKDNPAAGNNKVYTVEASYKDESGNPVFARKNLMVYAGEFDIYRKEGDYTYRAKTNAEVKLPVTLQTHTENVNVANITLTGKILRQNWIRYFEEGKKYASYKEEQEILPNIETKTDSNGNATLSFVPTKVGSYNITISATDKRGNLINKTFYLYVSSENQPYYQYGASSELTVTLDKKEYEPDDEVTMMIYSTVPDRDVLLTFERGRVNRYQVVKMTSNTEQVEVSLRNTDIPNIFATVAGFSNGGYDEGNENIMVSTKSKKLTLNLKPNQIKYGPGEDAEIKIETTDVNGNPVSADVAVWAVDKAIFELRNNETSDIFNNFWHTRYNGTTRSHSLKGIMAYNAAEKGGCFGEGTQVLMKGGKTKAIEEVLEGDTILTRVDSNNTDLTEAKVKGIHKTQVTGYLIINGELRVTTNHKLWINDEWKEAGSAQVDDYLRNTKGEKVRINSIEWIQGKFDVYNLSIEKYQTYFANGVWVHNEKGEARTVFKDTAYWNPSVHTNASGKATVRFKLPDNLTTWALAGIAATEDTRVGQNTNDIMVTKDVVIRPIVPNILREKENIKIGAVVQNFTDKEQLFDVTLDFDSGSADMIDIDNAAIKPKESRQYYWNTVASQIKDISKLTFSAKSKTDENAQDTIVKEIPVRAFGFREQRANAAAGNQSYSIKLAADSNRQESKVTLSLAPSLVGTLPASMKYLIDYPYGCVEQTTSRFVPLVIAKSHPELFAEATKDKDIDAMIEKGLDRLAMHQQSSGGWTWWYSGQSDAFITAYVVEYLIQVEKSGIDVDDYMMEKARTFLETISDQDSRETKIAKTYALGLFEPPARRDQITDLANLNTDILAIAVMANYKNGFTDPRTNGLAQLESMAKDSGNGIYWESGDKSRFGSDEASTAFAMRAILLANGNKELAIKGLTYLTTQRKSNYWSNTFGTAQTIRAIAEISTLENDQNPDYSYSVLLDGEMISQGTVVSAKKIIKDIDIPTSDIKQEGSTIEVSMDGTGHIFSTLAIDELRTDRQAAAVNKGIEVKREYRNLTHPGYSLATGDTAEVNITLSVDSGERNYGIIEDQLPAGFVPINTSFKNEQFNNQDSYGYYGYGYSDTEITENGAIISLYYLSNGTSTYTYKARVISEGEFSIPPATASAMYAPEIYGRSEAQTIQITKERHIIPSQYVNNLNNNLLKQLQNIKRTNKSLENIFVALLVLGVATVAVITRKIIKKRIPVNNLVSVGISKFKNMFKKNSDTDNETK